MTEIGKMLAADKEKKPEKPMATPKIKEIQVVALPTPMGQVGTIIYGLGEDSIPYVWKSEDRSWWYV